MTNNQQLHAMEISFDGIKTQVMTSYGYLLLKEKVRLMKFGIVLPNEMIREIELYILRNGIAGSDYALHEMKSYSEVESDDLHKCCPHCLKAYALNKGKEHGMTSFGLLKLSEALPGKIGHEGYYLDVDELVKV